MDALGWRKGGEDGGKRENEHIESFGEREITTHTDAAAATEVELTVKIAREADRSETETKTRA
mgnify:CR=1 FL=1